MEHTCNLSYLRGRDIKEYNWKTAEQKVNKTPHHMMVHTYNPCAGWIGRKITVWCRTWTKMQYSIWKITKTKRDGGMGQVVEHLFVSVRPWVQPQYQQKRKIFHNCAGSRCGATITSTLVSHSVTKVGTCRRESEGEKERERETETERQRTLTTFITTHSQELTKVS
jgi:hypothetical protein